MLIAFECEKCGQRYKVEEQMVGRRATCKGCGGDIRVPVPGPKIETSPSGSPVYRHLARERDFEPVIGDSESIDAITQHVEQFIGEIDVVFHEIKSDLVHIDVCRVPPSDAHPYYTLVTSGMSERPMAVPEEAAPFRFAELMLSLPADWPLERGDFEDEAAYWPIRLLKVLARLPHEYDTWLGVGHTIHNDDETPPTPYASNTKFNCALLLPPILVDDGFRQLQTSPDKTTHFLAVVPIYTEEINFKLKYGVEPLLEHFDRRKVTELLDVGRKNVCKRWWSF